MRRYILKAKFHILKNNVREYIEMMYDNYSTKKELISKAKNSVIDFNDAEATKKASETDSKKENCH